MPADAETLPPRTPVSFAVPIVIFVASNTAARPSTFAKTLPPIVIVPDWDRSVKPPSLLVLRYATFMPPSWASVSLNVKSPTISTVPATSNKCVALPILTAPPSISILLEILTEPINASRLTLPASTSNPPIINAPPSVSDAESDAEIVVVPPLLSTMPAIETSRPLIFVVPDSVVVTFPATVNLPPASVLTETSNVPLLEIPTTLIVSPFNDMSPRLDTLPLIFNKPSALISVSEPAMPVNIVFGPPWGSLAPITISPPLPSFVCSSKLP